MRTLQKQAATKIRIQTLSGDFLKIYRRISETSVSNPVITRLTIQDMDGIQLKNRINKVYQVLPVDQDRGWIKPVRNDKLHLTFTKLSSCFFCDCYIFISTNINGMKRPWENPTKVDVNTFVSSMSTY